MRLILQHANVRATDQLDQWVEQQIEELRPLLAIEEARIRLEYHHDASPAYRASAHLVIPGPDVREEAIDHTARTVLAKLMAQLRARAVDRADRRQRRHSHPTPPRGFARFGVARA